VPTIIEYVMKRPNKETDFPDNGEQTEALAQLREEHSVSTEVFFSDDELTRTLRHIAPNINEYRSFYEKAQLLWDKEKIVDKCAKLNIDISMDVVENT
jgi:hypothetical protein